MGSENPNFPEFLDICASENPEPSPATLGMQTFKQETAIAQYGIAGRIWEAAYILDAYLTRPSWSFQPTCPFLWQGGDPPPPPLTVLELGSGTGYAGFSVAKTILRSRGSSAVQDRTIVTDLSEVCPLLEENRRNDSMLADSLAVVVKPLAWGNSEHASSIIQEVQDRNYGSQMNPQLTHVLCSDLVYFPKLLAPLLRTLLTLTNPSRVYIHPIEILIAYKVRSLAKEVLFWSAFGLWFDYEPVLFRPKIDEEWTRFGAHMVDLSFVFVARRREGSLSWIIPADDGDLLAGVGASGTPDRKEDPTFETILLMNIDV